MNNATLRKLLFLSTNNRIIRFPEGIRIFLEIKSFKKSLCHTTYIFLFISLKLFQGMENNKITLEQYLLLSTGWEELWAGNSDGALVFEAEADVWRFDAAENSLCSSVLCTADRERHWSKLKLLERGILPGPSLMVEQKGFLALAKFFCSSVFCFSDKEAHRWKRGTISSVLKNKIVSNLTSFNRKNENVGILTW